jgi:hypothetical protein
MIIAKENFGGRERIQQENILGFDRQIILSTYAKIEDALQNQYKRVARQVGGAVDIRHFAFSQTCGALAGIIANLTHFSNPPNDIQSLIVSIQEVKDAAKRKLALLD